MAESVLRNLTDAAHAGVDDEADEERKWLIDSAGLADWNVGRSPEPRAIRVLAANGLHSDHITRQVIIFYQLI